MNLLTKIALSIVICSLIMLFLIHSADEKSYYPNFMLAAVLVAALGYLIGDMAIRDKGRLGKALVDLGWVGFGSISAFVAVVALIIGLQTTLAGMMFAALWLLLAVFFRLSKSVHDVRGEL